MVTKDEVIKEKEKEETSPSFLDFSKNKLGKYDNGVLVDFNI
jgi:hypothetical protein